MYAAELHDAAAHERGKEVLHDVAHGREGEIGNEPRMTQEPEHGRQLREPLRAPHRRPTPTPATTARSTCPYADRRTSSATIIAMFQNTGAAYDRKNLPMAVQDPEAPRAMHEEAGARKEDPREAHREVELLPRESRRRPVRSTSGAARMPTRTMTADDHREQRADGAGDAIRFPIVLRARAHARRRG